MPVIWEGAVEIAQRRQRFVLFRQFGCRTRGHRPVDVDAVPADSAVAIGSVEIGHLVGDLAIWFERHKSVRETDRHKQLVAILRRKLGADPFSIGGRATTNVDRHVENSPADTAYQLILAMRRGLEMKTAEGEGGNRQRVIVLNEGAVDAAFGQGRYRVDLREPPARVTEASRLDQLDLIWHERDRPELRCAGVLAMMTPNLSGWSAKSAFCH